MKHLLSATLAGIALIAVQPAFAQKKDITLEDIWMKGTFRMSSVYGLNSMENGEHYTTLESDKNKTFVVSYEYKTGKATDTILSSEKLVPEGGKTAISIDDYRFSKGENKILIATETEQIYRHSTREDYYTWDRKAKKLTKLSQGGKMMYGTFSPDGNKVAFVRDNNLFVKDLSSNTETQITKDGEINKIINGAVDWVYEEEFTMSRGFEWSPDGSKIAYYRFDESKVKEFSFSEYGTLYPVENRYKYPKAGEANSLVTVHIYDVNAKTIKTVDIGKETDQYIPRIKWTMNPGKLSLIRMNRHQSKLELLIADAATGATTVLLTEENPAYIEITDNLTFLKNGTQFIWTSDKDGYNHIYLYGMDGKMVTQLTTGSWDVMEFKGIDESAKTIYYISSESSPTQRDLYSIRLDGKNKKKLSVSDGTDMAEFSNGFKYYINFHSDANTPYYITLHNSSGKLVRVLEENTPLKKTMADFNISKKEFFKFKTADGVELNGWMIKPSNFDANKKYPVFMTVYGGPGHNTVNNSWGGPDYFWHQMIAQKGYIVVSVDNRGTEARGAAFKKATYKQMGKLEAIDQVEAAKYLGGLSYVDKNRIGIEGWSYGGYLTSLCMTKGADYFKMGIAVAPVTNWRYYDSIYTERYLSLPQENPYGYDDNSPINHVKNLKGKFLLVHGTADDNVHFQNSMEMVTALVKANKQFSSFFYPNKNHSIYGGNTRYHLYTMMTNFLTENL
jgi:dipeptidyl-peptidase-4